MNRPPRLSGSPAPKVRAPRREASRTAFSFSSDKPSTGSLFATHFGGVKTGADWSGSDLGKIKQQYNAGE